MADLSPIPQEHLFVTSLLMGYQDLHPAVCLSYKTNSTVQSLAIDSLALTVLHRYLSDSIYKVEKLQTLDSKITEIVNNLTPANTTLPLSLGFKHRIRLEVFILTLLHKVQNVKNSIPEYTMYALFMLIDGYIEYLYQNTEPTNRLYPVAPLEFLRAARSSILDNLVQVLFIPSLIENVEFCMVTPAEFSIIVTESTDLKESCRADRRRRLRTQIVSIPVRGHILYMYKLIRTLITITNLGILNRQGQYIRGNSYFRGLYQYHSTKIHRLTDLLSTTSETQPFPGIRPVTRYPVPSLIPNAVVHPQTGQTFHHVDLHLPPARDIVRRASI